MDDDIAIKVDSLSKVFKLPHEKQSSVKGIFVNMLRGRRSFERQKALTDLSFDIKKGEFFGIVGRNGSGKSTLLKLLAGIYSPTSGHIAINGSLTPFIELGVGFNMELTGRENVFLNGALLGFSRQEMSKLYDDIVSFAELHKFMDQKLKNYSSGMQVRLAFSIAIRANSDILLIDEVLAVGDAIFQKKCLSYFKQLKKNNKTVILVSHDGNILQEYCDQGILIEKGKIISRGKIGQVVNDYIDVLNEQEENLVSNDKTGQEGQKKQWGTGEVQIVSAETTNLKSNNQQQVFTQHDELLGINLTCKSLAKCENPVYGITVTDISGQLIFQSNTMWSKIKTDDLNSGDRVEVKWEVPNVFNTGDYFISPAVADRYGAVIYDWREEFVKFKVRKTLQTSAFINVGHSINVSTIHKVRDKYD